MENVESGNNVTDKHLANDDKDTKLLQTVSSDFDLEKEDGRNSNVQNVIKEIVSTKIPSLFKFPGYSKEKFHDNVWRGWILCSETIPIALLTTDAAPTGSGKSSWKKSTFNEIDRLILDKLVVIASKEKSVPVLPVNNVKIAAKYNTPSDLDVYGTTLRQTSGASLFEGVHRGRHADTHQEIIDKYGLPNVYKEEGDHASITKLRVFRASVTNKKGMCSLKERSRERLFLMFSPSDDNMQAVMNNIQIKNKMLRHEINTYLRPRVKNVGRSEKLKNAPFYQKRTLPPLKCVTDSGSLKKLPPLTVELIYDLFFEETEIEKDGYTILIKNQPLLQEYMTLSIIPKLTTPLILEKKKAAFTSRYSHKDREGEKVTPMEEEIKKVKKSKLVKEAPVVVPERSDPVVVQSVIEGTLANMPQLKEDMDVHLSKLTNYLRGKSGGEVKTRRKSTSQWSTFERGGQEAKNKMNKIKQTYEELEKPSTIEIVEEQPEEQQVDSEVDEKTPVQPVQEVPSPKPQKVTIKEPVAVVEKSSLDQILDQILENKDRLRKVPLVPPPPPNLPKYQSTGRKRFFMNNMQQYWAEYHTDVKTFYHNPINQVDLVCDSPIINDSSRLKPPTPVEIVRESSMQEYMDDDEYHFNEERSYFDLQTVKVKSKVEVVPPPALPPIITVREVDEVKHELGTPKYTYAEDKNKYAG